MADKEDKVYKANGFIYFAYSEENGLLTQTWEKEKEYTDLHYKSSSDAPDYVKETIEERHTYPIYDLMSGEEFYDAVNSGCIIDYDGTLSEIFVDGYKSNLGLCHKGFAQGNFMVDAGAFLDLCDNYKIEVNWANK